MAKSKAKPPASTARTAEPGRAARAAKGTKAAAPAKAAKATKPAAKATKPVTKAAPKAAKARADAAERERHALPARATRRITIDLRHADISLFAPLTEGERADAVRCLLEDERLRGLAKVGRYRVITVEPLVVKPPEPLAGRRLARLVIYDYASDRCVDACVDLDRGAVCHVSTSTAQPMLSRDEEAEAIAIADADLRVVEARGSDGSVGSAMHYWSLRVMDFAYRRRSAAVVYGVPGARPSLVAVVSLVDREVVAIVPAEQW